MIGLDGLLHGRGRVAAERRWQSGSLRRSGDVRRDGYVARNHAELIAGGLAALLEARIEPDARLLGCCARAVRGHGSHHGAQRRHAGLHHGFARCVRRAMPRRTLRYRCRARRTAAPQLAEAGLLAYGELQNVGPERVLTSQAWSHPNASLTDMHIFGEAGLMDLRRNADGLAVPLPLHAVMAPSGSANAMPVADIARTAAGTLAMRGMVPRHPFPLGAERLGAPYHKVDPEGFVDTFYPCRSACRAPSTVTGPPPGVASVGAYRVLSDLESLVRRMDGETFITALPTRSPGTASRAFSAAVARARRRCRRKCRRGGARRARRATR